MKIDAVLMCAGLSTRAGENKLLHKIGGKPLIEYTFGEMEKCRFNKITAVTRYAEIYDLAAKYGFQPAYNFNSAKGISTTIKKGVKLSDPDSCIMFLVCDQPQIKAETLIKICESCSGENIVVPRYCGKSGNPCIFPPSLRNELLELSGDCGGKKIITAHTEMVSYVDFDYVISDADTPEELLALEYKF